MASERAYKFIAEHERELLFSSALANVFILDRSFNLAGAIDYIWSKPVYVEREIVQNVKSLLFDECREREQYVLIKRIWADPLFILQEGDKLYTPIKSGHDMFRPNNVIFGWLYTNGTLLSSTTEQSILEKNEVISYIDPFRQKVLYEKPHSLASVLIESNMTDDFVGALNYVRQNLIYIKTGRDFRRADASNMLEEGEIIIAGFDSTKQWRYNGKQLIPIS